MEEPITSRPRTLKELAALYNVNIKTFKSWLDCNALRNVKPEKGYYFSIASVKIIVGHLGEP